MDPIKQVSEPVAEVRQAASRFVDEYGETWAVIDGIETKVPNIKAARALLAQQDATRVQIRADLDAQGLRFNPDGTDREEQVEIILDDGTKTTVGLLPLGKANYMQIGKFGTPEELFIEAAKAEAARATKLAQEQREARIAAALIAAQRRDLSKRSSFKVILDRVKAILKKGRKKR